MATINPFWPNYKAIFLNRPTGVWSNRYALKAPLVTKMGKQQGADANVQIEAASYRSSIRIESSISGVRPGRCAFAPISSIARLNDLTSVSE